MGCGTANTKGAMKEDVVCVYSFYGSENWCLYKKNSKPLVNHCKSIIFDYIYILDLIKARNFRWQMDKAASGLSRVKNV